MLDAITGSLPFKIIGIAIIVWSFYTLIAHPDRVLIDAVMHKKKVKYEEDKAERSEKTAAEPTADIIEAAENNVDL